MAFHTEDDPIPIVLDVDAAGGNRRGTRTLVPPQLVSVEPLDDLSTLGNDTIANRALDVEVAVVPIPPQGYMDLQRTPRRSNARGVSTKPKAVIPEEDYSDDEIRPVAGAPQSIIRSVYCIALICGPLLIIVILGLVIGLARLNNESDRGSAVGSEIPPFPNLSPGGFGNASPTLRPTSNLPTEPVASPTTIPTRPTTMPTLETTTSIPTPQQPTLEQPSAIEDKDLDGPTAPIRIETLSPSNKPTLRPTPTPTSRPTPQPSPRPTTRPTRSPTRRPTARPTPRPTPRPTSRPTSRPTARPTERPTTPDPTPRPTRRPTPRPTSRPTRDPTDRPTLSPASNPTLSPFDGGVCPSSRYVEWSALDDVTRNLAAGAGYDQSTWNHPASNDIEHSTYGAVSDGASEDVQKLLDQLGFSPNTWDCCVNHYSGASWHELSTSSIVRYFETLGWTEQKWTGNEPPPPSEHKWWYEFTVEEREAAISLCYTQELWDGISITQWPALEEARADLLALLASVSPFSLESILEDISSPQYRAFLWLTTDHGYASYHRDQVIQRWVLAVFALGLSDTLGGDGIPEVLSSWLESNDECQWDSGSSQRLCNSEGFVERIDFRETNLYGTLPPELSLLSNSLRFLYMKRNELHGTLPSELGSLTRLERLQISFNQIEGPIPSEIGRLENLRVLGLGRNRFSGRIPSELSELHRVYTFGIKENMLTGSLPSELGRLDSVGEIFLDGNDLTGTIPNTLSQLSTLESFTINDNRLIGSISDGICDLPFLETLSVDCAEVDCECCVGCS